MTRSKVTLRFSSVPPASLKSLPSEMIFARNSSLSSSTSSSSWSDLSRSLLSVRVKTGRNHLRGGNIGAGMSRFQLDVSDTQSILEAMERDNSFVPAYVFHCQVVDIPEPPTTRFCCVGIWWVSITSLIDNIEDIRQRPRENRPAAYIIQ